MQAIKTSAAKPPASRAKAERPDAMKIPAQTAATAAPRHTHASEESVRTNAAIVTNNAPHAYQCRRVAAPMKASATIGTSAAR
jgi:hypothetical protein